MDQATKTGRAAAGERRGPVTPSQDGVEISTGNLHSLLRLIMPRQDGQTPSDWDVGVSPEREPARSRARPTPRHDDLSPAKRDWSATLDLVHEAAGAMRDRGARAGEARVGDLEERSQEPAQPAARAQRASEEAMLDALTAHETLAQARPRRGIAQEQARGQEQARAEEPEPLASPVDEPGALRGIPPCPRDWSAVLDLVRQAGEVVRASEARVVEMEERARAVSERALEELKRAHDQLSGAQARIEAAETRAGEAEANAGEAQARAGDAEARASDAQASAGDALARADDAEARAGDAEVRASDAVTRVVEAEAAAAEAEARASQAQARAGEANVRADQAQARASDAEARASVAEARATEAEAWLERITASLTDAFAPADRAPETPSQARSDKRSGR